MIAFRFLLATCSGRAALRLVAPAKVAAHAVSRAQLAVAAPPMLALAIAAREAASSCSPASEMLRLLIGQLSIFLLIILVVA